MNERINHIFKVDVNTLTTSEKIIHAYIISNISIISQKTIYNLQEETFLSRASIDRYLKKKGFSGFKEFKSYVILYNGSLKKDVSNEINVLVSHLNNNTDKPIVIIGHGMSYIIAKYMKRRLEACGFFVEANTYEEVDMKIGRYSTLILISATGETKSINTPELYDKFHGNLICSITQPNSELAKRSHINIDNKMASNLSARERENMHSTIEIIEDIVEQF